MMSERIILALLQSPQIGGDEAISLMKARRIEKAVGHDAHGKLTGLADLEKTTVAVGAEPHRVQGMIWAAAGCCSDDCRGRGYEAFAGLGGKPGVDYDRD